MATTVKLKFSTGQVGATSLPDGVTDAQIQAVIDQITTKWALLVTIESAWLPVIGWERVVDGHFPVDRTFRSAWRHFGSGVVVDMPEARKIAATKLKVAVTDPAIVAATTPEELKVVVEARKPK